MQIVLFLINNEKTPCRIKKLSLTSQECLSRGIRHCFINHSNMMINGNMMINCWIKYCNQYNHFIRCYGVSCISWICLNVGGIWQRTVENEGGPGGRGRREWRGIWQGGVLRTKGAPEIGGGPSERPPTATCGDRQKIELFGKLL